MKNKYLSHIFSNIIIVALIIFSYLPVKSQNIAASYNSASANISSDNASLSVFPNPAADEATLVFNSTDYATRYQVRIVSNIGAILKNMEGTTVQGRNTLNFHVGNYPPGVYYVQVITVNGRQTLQLMKQSTNSYK